MSPRPRPSAFARASVELRGPGPDTEVELTGEPLTAAAAVEGGPEEGGPPAPRRTGHAFYADEARRALGIVREIRAVAVARVPAPLFHGAVGAGVAVTAVLVRPQATGWVLSIALDIILAVLTALAIIHYDLVLCEEETRPGPDSFILPVAAVISLAVSLAGRTDLRVNALAALIGTGVIVAAPHLAAMPAAGQETPLLGRERKTNQWFGDYVSEYNFQQSMIDGATVPLFYEKRVPQVLIQNEDLDDDFAEIVEDENLDDAQQTKLENRFAKEIEVIKREDRLETIAKDIVYHFPRRGYLGKGMVVSLDKFTAVKMHDKVERLWKEQIKELRGQIKKSEIASENDLGNL